MIDLSEVQPWKAPAPIEVGLPETTIFSICEQPFNAFSGIALLPFKTIVVNEAGIASLSTPNKAPIERCVDGREANISEIPNGW